MLQIQSPGSMSSQSSNRSSLGNPTNNHLVAGSNNMSPAPGTTNGSRVKGVPQSFGYVKRPGGQASNTNGQAVHQNVNMAQMQGKYKLTESIKAISLLKYNPHNFQVMVVVEPLKYLQFHVLK